VGIRLAVLATLTLLLVLPACAQTDEPAAKAASSAQDDVKAELDTMVVPQEAIGGLPLGLRVTSDSGWQDNRTEAENSINPNDSAASLRKAGRLTGYQLTYNDPTGAALESGSGILSVVTWVELYRSEAAASADLHDRITYKRSLNGASPRQGVTFRSVTLFDIRVGEDAYGVREDVVFGQDHVYRTLIGFRRGRVVAGAMFIRGDRADAAEATTRLAGQLDSRIQNALTGRINEEPVLIPKDGVPLHGQQPTTEKPAGVPDLGRVALGPADLPTGIVGDAGEYSRTKPPRFTFRRFFSSQGAAIGQTRLVGLRNEVSVLESETAASAAISLNTLSLNGPDAIRMFEANFAATSGLRARNVDRQQVSLEDGVVGFVTMFDTDAGPLVDFYVMVQRGRGTVTLEAFCLAEAFDKEDLLPLLDKVGDRLEAALD
jgi:hypothetical protein